jgi:hypothetical protein
LIRNKEDVSLHYAENASPPYSFGSSSQLTRMVLIRFANEIATHYQFAKSATVRENESIGSMSDRVYIFDTRLRDGEQSPGFRDKLQHFF